MITPNNLPEKLGQLKYWILVPEIINYMFISNASGKIVNIEKHIQVGGKEEVI